MRKIRIVALGDSITNGAGIGEVREEETFRHLMQEELPEMTGHEIEVINAGVNGDITTTAIHRLEQDVLRYKPDYVTVMFGVNDAGYYRPATDSVADTPRVTAARFRDNLRTIIEAIQGINSEPVMVTPVPMNSAYGHRDFPAYVENGLNYLVDEYADIIREKVDYANSQGMDVAVADYTEMYRNVASGTVIQGIPLNLGTLPLLIDMATVRLTDFSAALHAYVVIEAINNHYGVSYTLPDLASYLP